MAVKYVVERTGLSSEEMDAMNKVLFEWVGDSLLGCARFVGTDSVKIIMVAKKDSHVSSYIDGLNQAWWTECGATFGDPVKLNTSDPEYNLITVPGESNG